MSITTAKLLLYYITAGTWLAVAISIVHASKVTKMDIQALDSYIGIPYFQLNGSAKITKFRAYLQHEYVCFVLKGFCADPVCCVLAQETSFPLRSYFCPNQINVLNKYKGIAVLYLRCVPNTTTSAVTAGIEI